MGRETRYAESSDGVHVAFEVFGSGPPDLLVVWGFLSHVELLWEHAGSAHMYERLGDFSRVINFDKRGMGLSDPVPRAPTLEERAEDMLAVLDAVGSERAFLFGLSEGVPASILFAATYPERVEGLVLYGGMARSTFAPDHPWAAPAEALRAANREFVAPHWGQGMLLEIFAPSVADDPSAREFQGRIERHAAPPGVVRDLFELFLEIDVRSVVPSVHVPTLVLHRTGDRAVNVRASRWLARHLPDAELVEFPGIDHNVATGDTEPLYDRIEEFVTGARPPVRAERVLQTVLFTDLVGSTERASELGDARWLGLRRRHDELTREELERHGGREVKTLGDGFLATFDGPARAIRCATAVVSRVAELGLELRAGVHTGECEMAAGDVGGIAVHIAARVLSLAAPGEVLVTGTVASLVIGSGLEFEDRGETELRGVPGTWRVLRVRT